MRVKRPGIIAHRGWAGRYPENTLTAFRQALALPVAGFECDVRLTADDIPVILHDPTLERTTDGQGLVKAMPFAAVRRLNASIKSIRPEPWCPVPSLAETLQLYATRSGPPGVFDLEIKTDPDGAAELVRAILPVLAEHQRIRDAILLTSFDTAVLACLQRTAPQYARGLLTDRLAGPVLDTARALGCTTVIPNGIETDAASAAKCHEAGFKLAVWTVNDPSQMRRMIRAGVDWLITDHPDVALRVLAAVD